MLATFPTLKRWANNRCASGAIEIGTRLLSKVDSCDCPGFRVQGCALLLRPAFGVDPSNCHSFFVLARFAGFGSALRARL